MTDAERRIAARQFAADWKGRGDEKQDTQTFWLSLLQKVFGIAEPDKFIQFEVPVKLSHTSFIDGYIGATRVLIEQKGAKIDLNKGELQSDGSVLTPYQQARRYAGYLPHDMNPRWIVVCNFKEFRIHDMNRPNDTPETLLLSDLEKEYSRLNFLVDTGDEKIRKEMELSLRAGELVGELYDSLLKKYAEPDRAETMKSLNALCVRLVFCLYAEDAGVFGKRGMFYDYLKAHRAEDRRALINLFSVLDTKPENRDRYLDDDLAAFPYVNGGLFSDESIEIPRLGDEIIDLLLEKASADFDWADISPTIFGAVFESTLNPETRRSGGMHYTSIENIHKVIDPLFLDELKQELDDILALTVVKTRDAKLREYQQKLAGLTFLDPACGSGNFLTETYISLRRLENTVISELNRGQIVLDMGNPIQVSISQFYGIEINDFAVTVAKTALWIAESQMMKETEDVVHMSLDFLPLKTNACIVEGNALRIDWEDVVPKTELDYIMGNPPFVGASMMSADQKKEAVAIFGKIKLSNSIDYVGAWYYKAAELMQNTAIKSALVSTNSITQGEQVAPLWGQLLEKYKIIIDFAYRTFRWDSEANIKAHVHCVIIGFSCLENKEKIIFDNGKRTVSSNINPYLLDAPNVIITSRSTPICPVPKLTKGNQPTDDGNFILSEFERTSLIEADPSVNDLIKRYVGGKDFLNNNEKRYCLWLKDVSPNRYIHNKEIMRRLMNIKNFREKSTAAPTRKSAEWPYKFFSSPQTNDPYIVIPRVSSERRKYIPMGYLDSESIASDSCSIIPNGTLYHFGVLTSNVHMAWMRAVCERLKSDYRYSGSIVYNNFPWPTPTDEQRAKIEQTAQGILDARALYPDCSLADLYDEVTMPPELRKAHQANDKAVMQAYGFWGRLNTETACVAELMKMYRKLTE